MQLRWRRALAFMTEDDSWRRRLFAVGFAFFLFPPVGWLLALGYRSLTGERLVTGQYPLLPEWRRHFWAQLRRGIGAVAVILAYYTPFVAAYWWLGADSIEALVEHWRDVLAFVGMVIAFPPVGLPGAPVLYARWFEWLTFTAPDVVTLATVFVVTSFYMPSAFVQVALAGRYSAAFRLLAVVTFPWKHPRLYLEAWVISLVVSGLAVLTGPAAPWALGWSYLVILYAFNDALVQSRWPGTEERFARAHACLRV